MVVKAYVCMHARTQTHTHIYIVFTLYNVFVIYTLIALLVKYNRIPIFLSYVLTASIQYTPKGCKQFESLDFSVLL
jgi:hypothetical protein